MTASPVIVEKADSIASEAITAGILTVTSAGESGDLPTPRQSLKSPEKSMSKTSPRIAEANKNLAEEPAVRSKSGKLVKFAMDDVDKSEAELHMNDDPAETSHDTTFMVDDSLDAEVNTSARYVEEEVKVVDPLQKSSARESYHNPESGQTSIELTDEEETVQDEIMIAPTRVSEEDRGFFRHTTRIEADVDEEEEADDANVSDFAAPSTSYNVNLSLADNAEAEEERHDHYESHDRVPDNLYDESSAPVPPPAPVPAASLEPAPARFIAASSPPPPPSKSIVSFENNEKLIEALINEQNDSEEDEGEGEKASDKG